MKPAQQRLVTLALENAPLLLFLAVFCLFGVRSPKFLEPVNLVNILVQSSSTAIVAIGMTFVLLTAGVDLSVGAIMFVTAAIAGKMVLGDVPLVAALAAMLVTGVVLGSVNALFVSQLRIVPFIVTLATYYLGRGFALWLTETRAMNLPESFLQLGAARLLYVPVPILIFAAVLALAHGVLTFTPLGRQFYAVGHNAETARKAGINVGIVLATAYVICGLCAAIGAIVSLSQLGAVSPTFGKDKEFAAIAAAVLGGTSLFGGRGKVFPGTILGAVLIQTVESGLVYNKTNPYFYPLVISAIIFLAVLIDCQRQRLLTRQQRRHIRAGEG